MLVLPVIISLHLQKVWIFIFMLLAWHESIHIVCAKRLGYTCSEVIVYPFGLSARIKDFEMKNSKYEILITVAGLSVHIVMYFLLYLLVKAQMISNAFMLYLNTINMQIFCFNLLPIYPLDGGRIIANIYELIFPYRKAKLLTLLSSFLILLYYVKMGLLENVSGILVTLFFGFQIMYHSIRFKCGYQQFYLYRYLHGPIGKVKMHTHNDIYKNRNNVIIQAQHLKNEREFLSHYI